MASVPLLGNVSTPVLVVLALVIALAVVAIIYRLGQSQASASGGIEETSEARQQAVQDDSVGLGTRLGSLPTEGKITLGALLVALCVVGYEGFSFLQSGGPSGILANPVVQVGTVVAVSLPVAIGFERRRSANEGELVATVEADPESGRDEQEITVPIDGRDISNAPDARSDRDDPEVDGSSMVAYEYSNTRTLGVARSAKRIADDRALRDDSDLTRPVSDKIGYEIPPWATEVKPNVWHFRTKGRVKSLTPETEPDYIWLPPATMSAKEREQLRTDNRNLRDRTRELQVRIGSMSEELRKKEEELSLAREDAWNYVTDHIEEIQPYINGNMTTNQILEQIESQGHQSRDQPPFDAESGEDRR
ncbi:hypothetical protein [Halosegnis longus]|uniref:hypothetical protein n=1 Tax=Halosegnis longus TaxID=2216012 RepID=UPI00129ED0C9|nr:hypothetical protein [Halosegnis longus]